MTQLDIPDESCTLVTKEVARIVNASTKRDSDNHEKNKNIRRSFVLNPRPENSSEKDSTYSKRKERLTHSARRLERITRKRSMAAELFRTKQMDCRIRPELRHLKVQEQPYVVG